MSTQNNIIQTKLSIDRCLQQLSHIQAMFLFCEPRNMGMDAELMDAVIDLVSKTRRDLRQTHQKIEHILDDDTQEQSATSNCHAA